MNVSAWRIDTEDFRSAPDGRVVIRAQMTLTAEQSGAELRREYGGVVAVERGKITQTVIHQTWQDALDAAGLPR